MDVATLVGLLIGIGLLVLAISLGDGRVDYFIHYPSMLLVLGGTIGATFVNYPLKNLWRIFGVVKNAFRRSESSYQHIIDKFTELANVVRKQGIMALENELDKITDNFMHNGIELAINEKNQDRLRTYLQLELSNMRKRHSIGQEVFFYMGTYAPAFGMVGTIVGLIVMMKNFNMSGSQMGVIANAFEFDIASKFKELLNGMGMALITTFYGLILTNLIFIPIGGKLKRRSEEEIMLKEIMIEGILCLHNRDHPLVVREKLNTFVPRGERKGMVMPPKSPLPPDLE